MAVSRCPSCGDLYLTGVDTCVMCDVPLVEIDDAGPEPVAGDDPRPPAEFERRELHTWTMEGRRLLDGMLQRSGIPRSWQGAALLTPDVEHDRVSEMVSMVGAGDARVGVDPDVVDPVVVDDDDAADEAGAAIDVAYDLSEWTDLARGDLIAELAEAEVEHGWDDEGDLVVNLADEDRVDAIFARLTADDAGAAEGGSALDGDEAGNGIDDIDALSDGGEDDDDDGLLVQETLSDLFVGADRLMRNPLDANAALLAIGGRDAIGSFRLPFGFERRQWQTILGAVDELADSFDPEGLDDDAIRERASHLRGLLRDVV
ncbi:MAG: hypothetical protein JJE52_07395 [Acidimicrobiia bacterium]|nr:hypothetical protein [Acidimicrobiia bacterium]